MKYDYNGLENNLRTLLKSIKVFTDSELAEVLRFVNVGEYGLALETAYHIALEESKVVSDEAKAQFAQLAKMMGISNNVDVTKLK